MHVCYCQLPASLAPQHHRMASCFTLLPHHSTQAASTRAIPLSEVSDATVGMIRSETQNVNTSTQPSVCMLWDHCRGGSVEDVNRGGILTHSVSAVGDVETSGWCGREALFSRETVGSGCPARLMLCDSAMLSSAVNAPPLSLYSSPSGLFSVSLLSPLVPSLFTGAWHP